MHVAFIARQNVISHVGQCIHEYTQFADSSDFIATNNFTCPGYLSITHKSQVA